MGNKVKYIGEAPLNSQPISKLKLRLGKEVVKAENLAEKSVKLTSLTDEVLLTMQGVATGGIALAQGTGNSEVLGISQKSLTNILSNIPSVEGAYSES